MSSEAVRPSVPWIPERWQHVARACDPRVLAPTFLLCGLGLLSLAADRPDLVMSQLRWMLVGAALALAVVVLPFRRLLDLIYPGYLLALVALVLLFAGFGRSTNGATRWLQIGGFGLQPSEFAKVAVVAVLAHYVRFRRDQRTLRGLVGPFVLTLVPLALIMKQPDLGTALMLVPVLFVVLWAAGARPRHLGTVVALAVLSLPLLWATVVKDYQKQRVRGFVAPVVATLEGHLGRAAAPESSATETREARLERRRLAREQADRDYHRDRSLAAIASGGVAGHGFAQGPMNCANAVPESETDFVFTVHAEEWGFVGVGVLLLLELALLSGLAATAREVKEPAARLLAVGTLTLLGTQAAVNIAMTLGLAPITGLPLPFLSYGGSSMCSSWLLLGLSLNARAQRPLVFTERDFD